MKKVNLAIVGVGNCASALVQGIEYYKYKNNNSGLMFDIIGNYRPQDIDVVAAIDVDSRKVGLPVGKAIFQKPNNTEVFQKLIPIKNEVLVTRGPTLDGIANHMKEYPSNQSFRESSSKVENVVDVLKKSKADVLICYLPVGSQEAVEYYAKICLENNIAFINCVPVFIASNPVWEKKFRDARVPLIGDDIKSQFGATLLHRIVSNHLNKRGYKINRTYQLNTGGNTDFLNMLERKRLKSKKISKTQSVTSQMSDKIIDGNIHIGPSDYVQWQKDNKIAFVRVEGEGFGGAKLDLEMRLSVQDSPNSAGVAIDAIRFAALAKKRGEAGSIESVSAYYMKSPLKQFGDEEARRMVEEYNLNQSISKTKILEK